MLFQCLTISSLHDVYCVVFLVLFLDFPSSPSILRKSMIYDMPEVSEMSDTENEKSVYEAHLSSNLQNVSLTMNDKEGMCYLILPSVSKTTYATIEQHRLL